MKVGLQVRLSQHLALTPQLQQSIRLLQLSTLELQQEIEQMLDANPFLDVEDDDNVDSRNYDQASTPNADAARAESGDDASTGDAATSGTAESDGADATEVTGAGQDDWSNGTEGDDFDGIRETRTSQDNDSDDHGAA